MSIFNKVSIAKSPQKLKVFPETSGSLAQTAVVVIAVSCHFLPGFGKVIYPLLVAICIHPNCFIHLFAIKCGYWLIFLNILFYNSPSTPLSSDLLYSYHREQIIEYSMLVWWSMEKIVCKQPHLLAMAVIQVLEGTAPDSSFPWYVREISKKS